MLVIDLGQKILTAKHWSCVLVTFAVRGVNNERRHSLPRAARTAEGAPAPEPVLRGHFGQPEGKISASLPSSAVSRPARALRELNPLPPLDSGKVRAGWELRDRSPGDVESGARGLGARGSFPAGLRQGDTPGEKRTPPFHGQPGAGRTHQPLSELARPWTWPQRRRFAQAGGEAACRGATPGRLRARRARSGSEPSRCAGAQRMQRPSRPPTFAAPNCHASPSGAAPREKLTPVALPGVSPSSMPRPGMSRRWERRGDLPEVGGSAGGAAGSAPRGCSRGGSCEEQGQVRCGEHAAGTHPFAAWFTPLFCKAAQNRYCFLRNKISPNRNQNLPVCPI